MITDYFFVSNVCTGDYMNRFYDIPKYSPIDATASDGKDFMFLIDNIKSVNFSKFKIVPWEDCKIIKRGYTWSGFNELNNIDNSKTFGIIYDDIIELYYRHYEYNQENLNKIVQRIQRFKTCGKIPFFIFHITPDMCKIIQRNELDDWAKQFNGIQTENKLFVSSDMFCLRYIKQQKYKIYTTKLHEKLQPIIDIHLRKYFPNVCK